MVARRPAGRRRLVRALAALTALLALSWASALAQEAAGGTIRGVVYDKDFEAPLGEVRVAIVEALLSTRTGPDGSFHFEGLPPGSYTLLFSRDGYERLVVPDVVVTPGQLTAVRADLSSEVVEMEELVVTGVDLLADSEVGILEIRAEAAALQDAISSELIAKAGASDVAGALKLVVGASVSEGKYATVRGLSDRYTGTTLNGVRVPSADPRRKAVQVDLFPTGTIEGITVTKTFTPDLQGDFTGGGVDIRTKSVPDEFVFTFSATGEHNSLATGNPDYLTYVGGGTGAWGVDTGGRDLPAEAMRPLRGLPSFNTRKPSADQMARSLE